MVPARYTIAYYNNFHCSFSGWGWGAVSTPLSSSELMYITDVARVVLPIPCKKISLTFGIVFLEL